jgi:hypothetical protein
VWPFKACDCTWISFWKAKWIADLISAACSHNRAALYSAMLLPEPAVRLISGNWLCDCSVESESWGAGNCDGASGFLAARSILLVARVLLQAPVSIEIPFASLIIYHYKYNLLRKSAMMQLIKIVWDAFIRLVSFENFYADFKSIFLNISFWKPF